jgi:hypothetical protein
MTHGSKMAHFTKYKNIDCAEIFMQAYKQPENVTTQP